MFVVELYPHSVTLQVAERLSVGIPGRKSVNARFYGIKGVFVLVAESDYVDNAVPTTPELLSLRMAVSCRELVHAVRES